MFFNGNAMRVKGVLEVITDVVQITSDFKRRSFVIRYWNNPDKTEYLSFELLQDKCKLLDPIKQGDKVVVDFLLKGRKYTNSDGVDKYFTNLQAWNVELDTSPHPFFA